MSAGLTVFAGKSVSFGEPMTREQQDSLWKNATMFLAGVVLSLVVMWGTYVKNAVTRDEMENYVGQRQNGLEKQVADLNKNVIELKEATAALKAELAARDGKR